MKPVNFGSRKLLAFVLTLFSADGLLLAGALTSEAWSAVIGASLLAYISGNVAQKVWAPGEKAGTVSPAGQAGPG